MHIFTRPILPAVLLLAAPLSAPLVAAPASEKSQLIASIEGEEPSAVGWRKYGGLALPVVTEGGKKALDFNDEWETDWVSLNYKPSQAEADLIATQGFTIEARVRHVYSGPTGANFRVLARIPGMVAPFFVFYGDAASGGARISVYDSVERKSPSLTYTPEPDGYVTVTATYRPPATDGANGSFSLSAGGQSLGTFGVAPQTGGASGLEIGGIGEGAKVRTGQTVIQYLRMKTP